MSCFALENGGAAASTLFFTRRGSCRSEFSPKIKLWATIFDRKMIEKKTTAAPFLPASIMAHFFRVILFKFHLRISITKSIVFSLEVSVCRRRRRHTSSKLQRIITAPTDANGNTLLYLGFCRPRIGKESSGSFRRVLERSRCLVG